MFKSKFNLYNSEWLELVFSDRNKNYGAYDLRQHYSSNILKALLFTAAFITALLVSISFSMKQHDPITIMKHDPEILINLSNLKPPPPEATPAKKLTKAQPATASASQKPATSQAMKVTPDVLVKDDPKPIVAQNSTPGLTDIPVDGIAGLNTPAANNGTLTGTGKVDNDVKNIGVLEKLPEFPGGMEGWAKFLNKNLRYPEQASADGVSGRVYMSFTIEKDGRITDVQVSKPAGHGFDEEAQRVLKMAPQWKPGIQNGRAVRVRYTIPINFTIQE